MSVTIRDVARHAGVSVATVSYVLNRSRSISPETREKVLASVRQLDYHMNSSARSLAKRRTEMVALLLPPSRSATDPFLLQFMSGALDAATARGYGLLLTGGHGGTLSLENLVKSNAVDGLLLMEAHERDDRIPLLTRRGFPFTLFGRSPEYPGISAIDVDNHTGGYGATRYLIDMGHERIAFIGTDRRYYFSRDRYNGYVDAMVDAGLERREAYEVTGELTEGFGLLSTRELLVLPEPPTAILACSDLAAMGAQRAITEAGLRIPGDVSVIGYDGIPSSEHALPPLTTVRQPIGELGTKAMDMLLDTLAGFPGPQGLRLVKPELVVRASTGRAPKVRKD